MKFGKDLERDLVPEWRVKYFDYRQGKKHVKALARAVKLATPSPNPAAAAGVARQLTVRAPPVPSVSPSNRPFPGHNEPEETESLIPSPAAPPGTSPPKPWRPGSRRKSVGTPGPRAVTTTPSSSIPESGELLPEPAISITPKPSPRQQQQQEDRPSFSLPGPAMGTPLIQPGILRRSTDPADSGAEDGPLKKDRTALPLRSLSVRDVPRISLPADGEQQSPGSARRPTTAQASLARIQTLHRSLTARLPRRERPPHTKDDDVVLEAYNSREREFFQFMDSELAKVEDFYKLKEEQAGQRLMILQDQLREMRDRRTREVAEAKRKRVGTGEGGGTTNDRDGKTTSWAEPIRSKFFPLGPNSKALEQSAAYTPMMLPGAMTASRIDANRDFSRRKPTAGGGGDDDDHEEGVPYRSAKRKLKLALQEFHRSLELLKSYALLNQTAFRKLNKKYDKAVATRPGLRGRYVSDRVNKSWFVLSDVIDAHIRSVEDMYARHFERGNRKAAVGKLRGANVLGRPGQADVSAHTFWSGIMLGLGLMFAFQGIGFATQMVSHRDEDVAEQVGYLLQIYAGYFLMVLLFGLFCFACKIWSANKVNYPFVFEFDPRHHLDWRELSQFPCFFFLLLGVFVWLNFSGYGDSHIFLWYPVVLIGISIFLICLPAPIICWKSRRWLAISHGRLFAAGYFPVEFRDFFLGDMYCSLSYALANVSLFFCLYSRMWDGPDACNSSHSRVMGFFTAVPQIWRLLQCLRRYYDTRHMFPHLVNGGKYGMGVVTAILLSVFRIEQSQATLILYAMVATVNACICCVWDVVLDFSLMQHNSRNTYLRDMLTIKPRWIYYVVLVGDPILRFGWVPLAIFSHNAQHSSVVSFIVSLTEVIRRGLWVLLRVENEHCTNVAVYKASRDVPLPYRIETFVDEHAVVEEGREEEASSVPAAGVSAAASATGASTAAAAGGQGQAPATPGTPIRTTGLYSASPATPLSRTVSRRSVRPLGAQSIITPIDEYGRDVLDAGFRHPLTDSQAEAGAGSGAGAAAAASGFKRPLFSHWNKINVSQLLAEAHKEDFEKKREKPDHKKSRRERDKEIDEMALNDELEDDEEDGFGAGGGGIAEGSISAPAAAHPVAVESGGGSSNGGNGGGNGGGSNGGGSGNSGGHRQNPSTSALELVTEETDEGPGQRRDSSSNNPDEARRPA